MLCKCSCTGTLQCKQQLISLFYKGVTDCFDPAPQGRHIRRPGEEESDVDIEGFEEDDDGKPKTPAPVRKNLQLVFM